jgi:hypothetical protein
MKCLVAISQPAHAAHDTEHIVVGSIHAHSGGQVGAYAVGGQSQHQVGVVNAGQVAGAAGLVQLRGQGERIHVDTDRRHVGVVLVRLHLVEVAALAHLEPIMTVQLDQRGDHRVLTRHALQTGQGVTRLADRAIPPVGVVERLLALPGVDDVIRARHEGIALYHPDQLLHGVVEVQLDLVGGGGHGLTAGVLQHLNQVLMGHLGELAALISIQIHVIHIQRCGRQALGIHTVTDHVHVGRILGRVVPAEVAEIVELQVQAHLVVLERDQGQRQARVAAEPELQRDVQGVLRGARADHRGLVGLTVAAVRVAHITTLADHVGQLGHVTHHLGVTGLLSGLLGELIPDVQPVTIVLVNALATDLELDGLDQVVANPVEPTELSTRAISRQDLYLGEHSLEVDAVDQITVALDSAGHLLAEVGRTVERVLNRLHREVSVTTVHHLPEGNLGITSQVNILGAISDELHQTTTCHFLYTSSPEKKLAKTLLGYLLRSNRRGLHL